MRKIIKITTVIAALALSMFTGGISQASPLPAVRMAAERADDGKSYIARVLFEAPDGKGLNAICVTLKWDAAIFAPDGEPVVAPAIYSENAEAGKFETKLAAECDEKKGIAEIALGTLSKDGVDCSGSSFVLVEQRLKVKDGASGKTRIGFTTDPYISPNGTRCFTKDGELPFAVITPVAIVLN